MKTDLQRTVKRMISVLAAFAVSFSMTGCYLIFDAFKSHKNYKSLTDAAEEGNFITEWEDEIPEGMMKTYVIVKEQNSYAYTDSLSEHEYDYDKVGRRTVIKTNYKDGFVRVELTYNDDGLIIRKEQSVEGHRPGAPLRNGSNEYRYNDKKQLVSYKSTYGDSVKEYEYIYDENGHLVSRNEDGKVMQRYESDFNNIPYRETVAVVHDDFELSYPDMVERTYDENGKILTAKNTNATTTYHYDDEGNLTGSTKEVMSSTYEYDAKGNLLKWDMGGKEIREYEYNEHNDVVNYKLTREGEVRYRSKREYTYDEKGNKTSETAHIVSTDNKDGKEKQYSQTTTFRYDHGLLTVEEVSEDGEPMQITIHYYKAILVPNVQKI